jgi:hypothetical protein
MNIVGINKTYVFEVGVNAQSSNTVNFETINLLDGKLTKGLNTYISSIIPKAPSGNATANNDLLSVTYLNLVVSYAAGDVRQIWNLPLLDIVTLNAQNATGVGSNPFKIEFIPGVQVSWSKSYIFIADTTKLPVSGTESFLFNIAYEDKPQHK